MFFRRWGDMSKVHKSVAKSLASNKKHLSCKQLWLNLAEENYWQANWEVECRANLFSLIHICEINTGA